MSNTSKPDTHVAVTHTDHSMSHFAARIDMFGCDGMRVEPAILFANVGDCLSVEVTA
jgi:hypothetical protein